MKWKTYAKYKPSGVEWFDEVPAHWEILPLKWIVKIPITDGPHETPELIDEGIPFISAEAIKNYKIDFNKKRGFISESEHKRFCLKYHPRRNDIFIIKSGATTGNNAIVETDEEFSIWSPLAVIRVDQKIAYHRFVFNSINSKEFQTLVQLFWSYGTQQNIGMNVLENLPITVPSIAEQKAIAAFLDKETNRIDKLIEKKQNLIKLLKEKRSAMISRAVTKGLDSSVKLKPSGVEWLGEVPEHWEVKAIKYVCSIQTGDKDTVDAIDDGEFPFYVRSQTVERLNSYTYDCEAVLTAGDGVGVGKVFHYINGKFDFHQRVYMFNNFREITGLFLFYYLRENFWRVAFDGGAKSTVDSLRRPMIVSFPIVIPLLKEQEEIIQFLGNETVRIDSLISKVDSAIEKLKEYRNATISAAVTGKINVSEMQNIDMGVEI